MKEIEIKYGEARKRARLRWANSKHGKELSKNYMKEYRNRPYVKAKCHEYYIKNKAHWGEITKAKQRKANNWGGFRIKSEDIARNHYEWCKANGYDSSWYKNDNLNAVNTERFIKNAKK
jgi:hypothetical protein